MSQDLNLMPITSLDDIPMRGVLISTERIKRGIRMVIALDLAIRKSFLSRIQIDRIHLVVNMTKTDTFHIDVLNMSRTAISNEIWRELKERYGTNEIFLWVKPYIRKAYLLAKARKGLRQVNKTYYALRV